MQELCYLNGGLLQLVKQKEEEFSSSCCCIKRLTTIFLFSECFGLPHFGGSGLLGHMETPCHLACDS